MSEVVSATNYGDYVDLGTNLIVNDEIALKDGTLPKTDWRIFYKDKEGGIYLILADCLPYSYESIIETGISGGNSSYPYCWKTGFGRREEMLERLNDVNAWNKLIPLEYVNHGCYVKGAVDVETYVASANESGASIYLASDENGYYVGKTENPTTTSAMLTRYKLIIIWST